MRHVPACTFRMGSDQFYEDEKPVRDVAVNGFWMDCTPITNHQFSAFVEATKYVTFAENPPNPADYPGMDPALAAPGSIVFTPPSQPVDLRVDVTWWRFVLGADWRHPTGPASTLAGLEDHPVVHVAYHDAVAYATWAGKELANEEEWECAARGGLAGADYAWGNELYPGGRRMAKIWEGMFPHANTARPGLERTAPVASYPDNAYGLYDLIGNVWEWTATPYDRITAQDASGCCEASRQAQHVRLVTKGGSHLCAPEYCQRYRPAARWPQPLDTTTSHLGFRCIIRDRA